MFWGDGTDKRKWKQRENKETAGNKKKPNKKRWNLAIEEKEKVRIPIVNSNPRFPETAGKSDRGYTNNWSSCLQLNTEKLWTDLEDHRVTLEAISVAWDEILSPIKHWEWTGSKEIKIIESPKRERCAHIFEF